MIYLKRMIVLVLFSIYLVVWCFITTIFWLFFAPLGLIASYILSGDLEFFDKCYDLVYDPLVSILSKIARIAKEES